MNPFWQAPFAYGAGVILFVLRLAFATLTGKPAPQTISGTSDLWPRAGGAGYRDRAGDLRVLPARQDHGLGAGDQHVRDGHLGRAGGGRSFVRLRDDLPQGVHCAGRVGGRAAGHDHGRQRAAAWTRASRACSPSAEQSLADDSRPDRGLELRGVRSGLDAGPDRDDLLPDGHLPPLAAVPRAGPAAAGRDCRSWLVGGAGVAAAYGLSRPGVDAGGVPALRAAQIFD